MTLIAFEGEHNNRSRALADSIAHYSRIAQMAGGTEIGAEANRKAKLMRRRAAIENARYRDAVTSGDGARYWAWNPRWWRAGRLVDVSLASR